MGVVVYLWLAGSIELRQFVIRNCKGNRSPAADEVLDFHAIALTQTFFLPIHPPNQPVIEADADALDGKPQFGEQFRNRRGLHLSNGTIEGNRARIDHECSPRIIHRCASPN